jgi:hypothetical protein
MTEPREDEPDSAGEQLEDGLETLASLRDRGLLSDEEYRQQRRALLATAFGGAQADSARGVVRLLKWSGIGCAGLTLLSILLVLAAGAVAFVVVLRAFDDPAEDSGGDVRVLLAEGTSAEIAPERNGSRRSRVTIIQIADGPAGNSAFINPPQGQRYWAALVSVENTGDREVRAIDWSLRDSTGLESRRELVHDAGDNLPFDYRLTPGGRAEGWVVFAIASDATPVWLRADPDRILAHDLYFDAE